MSLTDPFGWPIVFFMGWRMGKGKKGGFWGGGFQYPSEMRLRPGRDHGGPASATNANVAVISPMIMLVRFENFLNIITLSKILIKKVI